MARRSASFDRAYTRPQPDATAARRLRLRPRPHRRRREPGFSPGEDLLAGGVRRLLLRADPGPPRGFHRARRARHKPGQRRFLIRAEIQQRRADRAGRQADDSQSRLDDADCIAATLVAEREIRNEEASHRLMRERMIA